MKHASFTRVWILAGMLAAGLHGAHAAVVFTGPHLITGASDVVTQGTTVFAANLGVGNLHPTVNGIAFTGVEPTGTTVTLPGGYGTIVSGATIQNTASAYGSASNPFASMDAAYKGLLQSGVYQPNVVPRTFTITLQNLKVGSDYLIQLWVNDARGGYSWRSTTFNGENSVSLAHGSSGTAGSPGYYAIGTFKADATTLVFTATSSNNGAPQINGFQLRDVTVPEPGTALMFGFGTALLFYIRRRL
jgi:hypothetical protein